MNIILEGEYGSRAHGTHTIDSDRDVMGVFVEPRDYVTGIFTMDTQERKSAVRGERSTAADTDGVYYPLRKWAALAAKGNPTVLTLLFLPDQFYTNWKPTGQYLLDDKKLFLSKQVGERFLGYMISQRNAMLGLRNKKTNRPELVHTHGFDTKFAGHMIRLGLQGIEMMERGFIDLPMWEPNRNLILDIRAGKFTKEKVLDISNRIETDLRAAIGRTKLPDEPDYGRINQLLHEIYEEEWSK
jgi:uncharacterized protein